VGRGLRNGYLTKVHVSFDDTGDRRSHQSRAGQRLIPVPLMYSSLKRVKSIPLNLATHDE
jgi:hypothetical protein